MTQGRTRPEAAARASRRCRPWLWRRSGAERDARRSGVRRARACRGGDRVRLLVDDRDPSTPRGSTTSTSCAASRCELEIGPRDVAAGTVMSVRRTHAKSPSRSTGWRRAYREAARSSPKRIFSNRPRGSRASRRRSPRLRGAERIAERRGFVASRTTIRHQEAGTGRRFAACRSIRFRRRARRRPGRACFGQRPNYGPRRELGECRALWSDSRTGSATRLMARPLLHALRAEFPGASVRAAGSAALIDLLAPERCCSRVPRRGPRAMPAVAR